MTQKQKKEILSRIAKRLADIYPDAPCALEWEGEPWKLLIMGRLSAQCTDARVNIGTKELFSRFTTLEAIANADVTEIEECIKSCGLYKTKARDLKLMAQELISRFDSVVPDSIEELITLPGVGRKTANLIVGDVYGKAAVVVDTHCIRITNRIGLVNETDPKKIEFALKKILPPEESSDFCHRIVLHRIF